MTDSNSHSEETQEISLRLEHYDDMFSDFDIRPYSKRALSVDFLDEIKRAIRDGRYEQVELVLHIPAKEVSESHQATIRDRLSGHFKRHFDLLLKEKRKVRRLGVSMVILGIVSMVAATVIVFEDPRESLLLSFLVIFLEPAAWFLLWEGMDQIIFNSKSINPELDFYRKMSNSHGHVHFSTY
ncbi:MAG: hypothetical protein A2928_03070 [Candidatus Taylorbacteria bacterium RIFCSPLOWO2_01_FULL_45_15b]|uniref:SMODS and SLOG-associating 2TM effector domain-containing protein n=1 Tax=Candidatus Taylorbacteria bacterium RIFCSPLOWO2_01_FULL_45_15b TaxID=1802319 RepID=A0A1G2NCP5_9BACT|nr:MAG: hypothetical protein A2928_03070 [Candidatus Taylorbacteria bacterium RIFCSPLOWO2_01_FULL_45_15b]